MGTLGTRGGAVVTWHNEWELRTDSSPQHHVLLGDFPTFATVTAGYRAKTGLPLLPYRRLPAPKRCLLARPGPAPGVVPISG